MTMSLLVILALTTIVCGTSTRISSKERDIVLSISSITASSNDLDFADDDYKKISRTLSQVPKSSESTEAKSEKILKNVHEEKTNVSSSLDDQRTRPKSSSKKLIRPGQKAKFLNYPFVVARRRVVGPKHQMIANYEKNFDNNEQIERSKTLSNKNRLQQESQIYYIKLPPTPYTYVPGYGYISQPPTYSSPGLERPSLNHPTRPQIDYQKPTIVKNPFIKLPVDFVSNGKPTGVYQWPANKRRESTLYRINDGPYAFNGRPTSLYLLNKDGKKTGHRPLRSNETPNEAYRTD